MKSYSYYLMVMVSCVFSLTFGCGVSDKPVNRRAGSGLITTPPTYYSTPKARYLGERYNQNLDRMVEQIVRNPKTSTLQFANNIATVGGIGFFTHSATKTPDERYLEVVLGVPETFQVKGEQSAKVLQIFSTYGLELLAILAADPAVYQEKEVTGYGLNFSWRSVVAAPAGSRVIIERAIVYAPKEKVRSFLRREIKLDGLLGEAVIFAAEEDAPLQLVSYRPVEATPDYRLPQVQEETIVAQREGSKVVPRGATPGARLREARVERPAAKDQVALPASDPNVSPVPRAAAPTEKMNSPASVPEAKPVEEHSGLPEQKTKGASHNQATREPLPKEVAPASGAINPAKAMKRGETKEKAVESTSVANTAEPAVKPPFQKRPSGAASVISPTERGSTPPASASSPAVAASAKADKAVESKSVAPSQAKEKPDESISASRVQQNKQAKAKAVSTPVESATSSLPAPIDEKSTRGQPNEGQGSQQIAMKKASGPTSVEVSRRRSASRSLEGYIIQLSFAEKVEARRWAETLGRRGHTVSMTEAGGGSIRVRIGSFSQRTEAEQQLQRLRQDGLSGIVLNLPQAYRPETSPAPQEVTKTGAVAQ
jgi:hypothetical protein